MNRRIQTNDVLEQIADERYRQDVKWGEQNHPDGTGPLVEYRGFTDCMQVQADVHRARCKNNMPEEDNWRDILLEEVFEAIAEDDTVKLRTELIQVAAVAAQWVEAIARREQASL